jgi:hypothetical protein
MPSPFFENQALRTLIESFSKAAVLPQMQGLTRAIEVQQAQQMKMFGELFAQQLRTQALASSFLHAPSPTAQLTKQLAQAQVPKLYLAEAAKVGIRFRKFDLGAEMIGKLKLVDFEAVMPKISVDPTLAGLMKPIPPNLFATAWRAAPRVAEEVVELAHSGDFIELGQDAADSADAAIDAVSAIPAFEEMLAGIPRATLRLLLVSVVATPTCIMYMAMGGDHQDVALSLLIALFITLIAAAWPGDDSTD